MDVYDFVMKSSGSSWPKAVFHNGDYRPKAVIECLQN